jgi:hypothetical protein
MSDDNTSSMSGLRHYRLRMRCIAQSLQGCGCPSSSSQTSLCWSPREDISLLLDMVGMVCFQGSSGTNNYVVRSRALGTESSTLQHLFSVALNWPG